ncbi:hypothetical protein [Micromonospora globbae]|uniref:Uncharacterized protein n=1 Tax=Micromonospora globbae TaxID=1894969 RepID=A0ABZ1S0V8_9ACTN|nr:hypothetical protein [Micromonospora globbae]WTF87442.1 hypothetical protein OH732_07645 [Micromonospora globbae]
MRVLHQPRVAWNAARVFVGSVRDDDLYGWLSAEVGDLLGVSCQADLDQTRERLRGAVDPQSGLLEVGRWRVRLEDELRRRPALAEPLESLSEIAAGLLRRRAGPAPRS